eukprot:1664243-Prymnesium_polylepis.1
MSSLWMTSLLRPMSRCPSASCIWMAARFAYRFANDPLLSYPSDKTMIDAVIAMDDTWQAKPLEHSKGHFGQVTLLHELVTGGDFEGLMVPRASWTWFGLEYARGKRGYATPSTAQMVELEDMVRRAPNPFGMGAKCDGRRSSAACFKIAAVEKVRSRFTARRPRSDWARVTITERSGRQHALASISLPSKE